jgi:hypothetical protein
MKMKAFAAACALVLAGPAMASCSKTTTWGDLGAGDVEGFFSTYASAGSFTDCYKFNLTEAATGFGGFIEIDPYSKLDVSSVSLFLGSSLVSADTTPADFKFASLGIGSYTLAFSGTVKNVPGTAAYVGGFATVAAPVPEPEAYAMMLAGFFGVGVGVLRRKKAAPSA